MDYTLKPVESFKNDKRAIFNCILPSDLASQKFGQIYALSLKPGVVVGNHFHRHKQEFLVVLKGKVSIFLEDSKTKKRAEFVMCSDKMETLILNPGIAHAVKNVSSKEALLLEYSSEAFNKNDEDKEFYPVTE